MLKKINILMSTYNGEKYLNEQLNSIFKQSYKNFNLLIRDDGSTDETINIIKQWQSKNENIYFFQGKNIGVQLSFMELLKKNIEADYYAFCDQDDFWETDKLKNAIEQMENVDNELIFYYSEVKIVDKNLNYIAQTNYTGVDTIGSAFATTPVIGCTAVFNKNLRDVVVNNLPNKISMHDSWVYRSCLALDGKIIHDKNAYILYRQHDNNVVGISNSFITKIKDYFRNYKNAVRVWTAKNLLISYNEMISNKNAKIIKKISTYDSKMNFVKKISYILDKNYRTHKLKSDCKFICDILFGKI